MTHLQFLAAPNSTCRRRVLLCAVFAGCRLDWRPHRVICGVVARGKGYSPVLFTILGFFTQWCPDCNRPCHRLGPGGEGGSCGELLTVDELLAGNLMP